MNIKYKFGIKLKEIRKKKNLTQEKLSEISGLDRSYISDIERGKRSISIEKIEKLSQALKIEIKIFFE